MEVSIVPPILSSRHSLLLSVKQVSNLCYGEAMVGAVFPVANAQLTYHCADCIKTKVQTVMHLTKVDRIPIITNDHNLGSGNSVAEPNVWDDWTWRLVIFYEVDHLLLL